MDIFLNFYPSGVASLSISVILHILRMNNLHNLHAIVLINRIIN